MPVEREIRLGADTAYVVAAAPAGEVALNTPFGVLVGPPSAFRHLEQALERARRTAGAGGTPPNRTLYVRDDVLEKSKRKADRELRDLADVILEGFAYYLAGNLELRKPQRAAPRAVPPGSKAPKSLPNCSVRMHDPEWQQVADRCEADKVSNGWSVNPSKVITQFLEDVYLAA